LSYRYCGLVLPSDREEKEISCKKLEMKMRVKMENIDKLTELELFTSIIYITLFTKILIVSIAHQYFRLFDPK